MTHRGLNRRRTSRHTIDWKARYALHDGIGDWHDCRVIDVSLGGAALVLLGPAPRGGGGLEIRLRPSGEPVELHLHALSRNVTSASPDGTRVGVEWHEITRRQSLVLNHFVNAQSPIAS
jgi:hypothetical protein